MVRILFIALLQLSFPLTAQEAYNLILVITDDQGYGDFGFTGNSIIETPTIDSLAQESVHFTNFHVSPVCAPTRASLMTGRYSLRTGVRDTYNGGAIMSPEEITIAEVFKQNNYKTGIFGKWHLGDNYPSRPMDQGFDESVIHLAGGMGQVGDITTYFQYDRSYFDPVLWKNGLQEQFTGYCSDIFTDQAIQFIQQNKDQSFFCYLSFNAPHTPLQVPDEWLVPYQSIPDEQFQNIGEGNLEMNDKNIEDARRVYAMASNIDANLSRLFNLLDQEGLKENTIVIFMTDNGPQQRRYLTGLRGLKSSVYEGGVRVPLLIRHPDYGVQHIDQFAAHIDILPTIVDFCGLELPENQIDGISLVPIIQSPETVREKRTFLSYWTRKYPTKYHNIALHQGDYKLVGNTDATSSISDFELYNLSLEPEEKTNVISHHMAKALSMKATMDSLLSELAQSEHLLNPPTIMLGTAHENPVLLNRNDADGQRGIWAQDDVFGYWKVDIQAGTYDMTIRFRDYVPGNGTMNIEMGNLNYQQQQLFATNQIVIKDLELSKMNGALIPFYMVDNQRYFPFWVEMNKQ